MRVTLPDALVEHYETFAQSAGVSVDEVLAKQLTRFQQVHPFQRAIVLGHQQVEMLDEKLHGGMTRSAEELVEKIDRLAGISFCAIDLRLTPAQLEELANRAARQGKPVEDLVREIWQKLSTDFFYASA